LLLELGHGAELDVVLDPLGPDPALQARAAGLRLRAALAAGERVHILDRRTGLRFSASCALTARERDILLAGGLLAYTRARV
jgi:hypothetical protein